MTLVGTSGRVGALAPARHARRVRLPEAFFPPGERGLFSTVRSKTLKKKKGEAPRKLHIAHWALMLAVEITRRANTNKEEADAWAMEFPPNRHLAVRDFTHRAGNIDLEKVVKSRDRDDMYLVTEPTGKMCRVILTDLNKSAADVLPTAADIQKKVDEGCIDTSLAIPPAAKRAPGAPKKQGRQLGVLEQLQHGVKRPRGQQTCILCGKYCQKKSVLLGVGRDVLPTT